MYGMFYFDIPFWDRAVSYDKVCSYFDDRLWMGYSVGVDVESLEWVLSLFVQESSCSFSYFLAI